MTAPTIYHYHPATGEFLGTGQADPDPLEKGSWLLPANAVTQAPPDVPQGHVAVWSDGDWSIVEDHRGEIVWFDYDTPAKIEELGPLPEGAATERPEPPPPTAAMLREQRNEKIRQVPAKGFGGPSMKDVFHD